MFTSIRSYYRLFPRLFLPAIILLSLTASLVSANVTLTSYEATSGDNDGEIIITWSTETETDIAVFVIDRQQPSDEFAARIHQEPPRGSASTGADYTFTDSGLQPGESYTYTLYEIMNDGGENALGSRTAVAAGQTSATATPTATATEANPTATPTTERGSSDLATATPTTAPTNTPIPTNTPVPSTGGNQPTATDLPTLTPTPTPTGTPQPATPTPIPPTATPEAAAPTATPTLPPPTDTPEPATPIPPTPVPPVETPPPDAAEKQAPSPTPTLQSVAAAPAAAGESAEQAEPVEHQARPTATPRPQASESNGLGSRTSLLLTVGAGSLCGAVLLVVAALFVWRRQA